MKEKSNATNAENTVAILLKYLGSTYDDFDPEIKEKIIKAFGLQFDQVYFEGQASIIH